MHILKVISVFLFIFSLQNCATKSNQNFECKNFKTGKFELINSEENRKYIIERNTKIQIEKIFELSTNKKLKEDRYYEIVWENDCEYQLKLDTLKSKFDYNDLKINSMGGLQNKIIKIDKKCAEIQTTFQNLIANSKICKK